MSLAHLGPTLKFSAFLIPPFVRKFDTFTTVKTFNALQKELIQLRLRADLEMFRCALIDIWLKRSRNLK
jgi:hypothetical protein